MHLLMVFGKLRTAGHPWFTITTVPLVPQMEMKRKPISDSDLLVAMTPNIALIAKNRGQLGEYACS